MANLTINDKSKTEKLTAEDSILFQKGGSPAGTTDGAFGAEIANAIMGRTIGTQKTVCVYTEADIGVAAAGVLTLQPATTYIIMRPITTANKWAPGALTRILDLSYGGNVLTFTGATAFEAADLVFFQLSQLTLAGNGTNKLFDINSASAGFLSLDTIIIDGFLDLGNINDISNAWQRITCLNFTTGLTCASGGFFGMNFVAFLTAADATVFDFSGTFTGTIVSTLVDMATGASGFGYKVDNAISAQSIRIRDNSVAGGTMFDPAGLDEQALQVQASGNLNTADSTISGSMSMSGNLTFTVVGALEQNVYLSILGTTTAGAENERVSHATAPNILTYAGAEPNKNKVHVVITASKTGSSALYDFGLFKNGVLIPNAIATREVTTRPGVVALQFIVPSVTNDYYEVKVKNVENTDDVLIDNLVMTVAK